jgi:hypothetical protein
VNEDQLKSLLSGQAPASGDSGGEAPGGSSTSGEADIDTATTTTSSDNEPAADTTIGESVGPAAASAPAAQGDTDAATSTTPVSEREDADARGDTGDAQAPAVPAPEGGEDGGSAEAVRSTTEADDPSPAADAVSPPSTEAANNNAPAEQPAATGTE